MLTRDPRILLDPKTWVALAKLGVVLSAEVALAPAFLAAVTLDRWVDPRAVLQMQNALRRRALRWMYPHFGR